jgi:hypothetical protein
MSAPDYPSAPAYPTPASDQLRDDAAKLTETAQSDLAQLGEEVKHQAAALGEEAKAQIGEVAEKAKGLAAEQKELISGQLSGVSDALQRVASELEAEDQSSAHYVRIVADGAARLTSSVRDKDVDQLMSMAQDFGRRQPGAFLGVAALLGFAASRFVLASASRPAETNDMTTETNQMTGSNGGTSPTYAQSVGGSDAGI